MEYTLIQTQYYKAKTMRVSEIKTDFNDGFYMFVEGKDGKPLTLYNNKMWLEAQHGNKHVIVLKPIKDKAEWI